MPEYKYRCTICKTKFSICISMMSKPSDKDIYCPKCRKNGIVKRIFENFSFVLNGKGFYSTDQKVKNKHEKE